ncbi:hypothetical protein F4819DRAFT_143841 [Hypoxylon fuscum]|nr:hypothetical protein F4819DRAFT_143841 [Hypoxylon fuscum]
MSVNVLPSDTIRFCGLCNKPISTESAYKRHVQYCRRSQDRPRRRPRSCKECHSAKAKCSFESESCSRCLTKGLICLYEGPIASNTQLIKTIQHPNSAPQSTAGNGHNVAIIDPSLAHKALSNNFGSSTSLSLPASSPRSIADLVADPVAQHSAGVILESVRGLPLMMASRETFSWFSHGFWYQPKLPQSIARCSELANLYTSRASAEDNLWSAVNEENRQLLRDLPGYSLNEMISGMQAQIIYMVMFALDSCSGGIPEIRLQMLMTFDLYCKKFSEVDQSVWFVVDEHDYSSVTWEDWIHNETRRRCAITWFILSRVMDLKFGAMCPSITSCRTLPLPGHASLWNARTRAEWEASRRIHGQSGSSPLKTFGDLIEARSSPPNSDRGQALNRWHAGCDKLGLLLTLATTMI